MTIENHDATPDSRRVPRHSDLPGAILAAMVWGTCSIATILDSAIGATVLSKPALIPVVANRILETARRRGR